MRTTAILALLLSVTFFGLSQTAAQTAPASTADAPTTASTAIDSPRATLKAYNAAMRSGDIAAMVSLQHATNEDQRRVARASAQSDVEVGRLIKAAREKFGDEGALKIGKAANDENDSDIDAAEEIVTGDTGGVKFEGSDTPTPMIKFKGKWLVDISALVKQFSDTPDKLSDSLIRHGSAAKVTAQELQAGQFKTIDAAVTALTNRLKEE